MIIAMFLLGGFGVRSDSYLTYPGHLCSLRDSLFQYHHIAGWGVYKAGGHPLLSSPDSIIFELAYFIYLIFGDANIALSLGILTYISFGIAGMYLLLFKLTKNNKASILSCIPFLFWFSMTFAGKHLAYSVPYAFLPWIFLLYGNMGKDIKKIILNSILIGILLTIASLSAAGMQIILWTLFTFPLYIFIDLFILSKKNTPNLHKIRKLLLILLIMGIIFLGLSAFKIYPSIKFIEKTNRGGSGFALQEFIGEKVDIKDFLIMNVNYKSNLMKTGILSLIMVCVGLLLGFKKRIFLKFFFLFILGIIITSNLFSIANLLVLVPFLNKARHIIRFAPVYHFLVAVLVGLSFNYICQYFEKRTLKKWVSILFILILFSFSFELVYIQLIKNPDYPMKGRLLRSDFEKNPYEALNYLGNVDTERHRIHMLGIDWVQGGEGEQYFCDLGIETMDWVFGNAWLVDYTTYTLWAGTNLEQAAKLWGILNTKYVTAQDPKVINPGYTKSIFSYKNDTDYFVPGLSLVNKFDSCEDCRPDITHLYENTRFLPRVFLVDNSILIIGERDNLYNLYNFILFNDEFEPKTTVLIGKEDIKDEDINKYSAIIITRQLDPLEMDKLRQFKESGGELFPDIFNNENQLNAEKLTELLKKWKAEPGMKELKEEYYSPNHRIYNVEEKLKGFAVISENFYKYDDEWIVTLDSNDKEIYNANFIVSAVYIDNEKGDLDFRYNSIHLKKGGIISIITLILVISLFIFLRKKKPRKEHHS
ncbi:MAG: hypothetical protein U9O94_07700 [Nanoarchaeota archaeon]|nr:hypothetical protein [Nanoarchaeota archaeon]